MTTPVSNIYHAISRINYALGHTGRADNKTKQPRVISTHVTPREATTRCTLIIIVAASILASMATLFRDRADEVPG